jgi:hypothetical protein
MFERKILTRLLCNIASAVSIRKGLTFDLVTKRQHNDIFDLIISKAVIRDGLNCIGEYNLCRKHFFSPVSILPITLEMRVETLVSLLRKAYVIDFNSNWNVSTSLVTVPDVILHEYLLNDS